MNYKNYKPSGIEWIGEIPEHWEISKLKYSVKHIVSGGTPSTSIVDYWDNEKGIPWVSISDISKSNGILIQTEKKITLKAINDYNLEIIPKGTILVSIFASLGKMTLLNISAVVNQAILGLIANDSILIVSFIRYYFSFMENYISYYSSENTQENLNLTKIKNLPVILPPLSEQILIANFLDDKTSKIDSLIEKKKKLIELYKEERTAVINHYVLGQHLLSIDNSQLTIDNYPLSINNYQLPKHWEVKKLKYVLSIKSGDGIKSEEIDFEGTYPVYGGNGIMGYSENFNSDKLDIIIGRVGAKCGNVRLVDGKKWISDNALVAKVFEGFDHKFISILLESINLNSLANQNAQPLITGTLVREKVVCVPQKIEEQQQIVEYIEAETKRIDEKIKRTEKEIELLQEYRTVLISEVVTGKIKVIDNV